MIFIVSYTCSSPTPTGSPQGAFSTSRPPPSRTLPEARSSLPPPPEDRARNPKTILRSMQNPPQPQLATSGGTSQSLPRALGVTKGNSPGWKAGSASRAFPLVPPMIFWGRSSLCQAPAWNQQPLSTVLCCPRSVFPLPSALYSRALYSYHQHSPPG